jgi:formate hydrogenlyase subunit 6/NADH:ubiquinone oxidoreductase subunit I
MRIKQTALITVRGFADLIQALHHRGYAVVGPTRRDGAIVYDRVDSVGELPAGWTDEHGPGHYRLRRRDDAALFGYVVGPHSWKQQLHPPRRRLWRARRSDGKVEIEQQPDESPTLAFIGVRSCDLHAIDIQDRVFVAPEHRDEDYRARREQAFIVAVNCTEARQSCFCGSMGTGPRADGGHDLALTELLDADRHDFLVEVGSERGQALLDEIATRDASEADHDLARRLGERALSQMGRRLDTVGLKQRLQGNPEHPRWDEVASRCLACANCTMVCPTCFCTSVHDSTDLDGQHAERWLRWDSCFNPEHAYVHGGSLRPSTRARYRQWLTHKLAHWIDQFGVSGCVGCGRCITWCPAGIDITEEAAAIRDVTVDRSTTP